MKVSRSNFRGGLRPADPAGRGAAAENRFVQERRYHPKMAIRSAVEMAAFALGDAEDQGLMEADVNTIVDQLEKDGVEELCDLCLAFGGDDGMRAAARFAESTKVAESEEILKYIAASVSEQDLEAELGAQAPAPKRRKRHVQDGRLVTDYSDLAAAKRAPKKERPGRVVPPSLSKALEGSQSARIERAISAAESAARLDGVLDHVPVVLRSSDKAAKSIAEKDARLRTKAIELSYNVLSAFGLTSKRFVELYMAKANPSSSILDVQDDIFMSRTTAQTVIKLCAEIERYLEWLTAVKTSVADSSALILAAYLMSARARGKSVPNKARTAFVWAEQSMDVQLYATEKEVMRLSWSLKDKSTKDVESAVMLPIESVLEMERLVFEAPSFVLRCFAGVICLMIHGLKRWSDVLHTRRIELTEDALVLCCYKSKRKSGTMTWGALRKGFTGLDWGAEWLKVWNQLYMTGDFIIFRPTQDLRAFRETVADHADATRALHALLTLAGMGPAKAASFTTHSCRHVLPTVARQLRMPRAERDAMGRWGEGMADYYDSIDCVAELASKEWVRANVEAGWRPVGRGRLPRTAKVARQVVQLEKDELLDEETMANSRGFSKGGAEQLAWCQQWVLPEGFVQVLNTKKEIVHLYMFGKEKTACGVMKCKSPIDPAANAQFADIWICWNAEESSFEFCVKCYGAQGSVFSKYKESRSPVDLG